MDEMSPWERKSLKVVEVLHQLDAQPRMDIAAELQKIYDSEINVEILISWLWDGGIEVRLGDRLNGFLAETNVPLVVDILPWLQEAIAHFYPDSTYAKDLPMEVRDRARRQIFVAPMVGAQVTCPHCGARNPNLGRMEEIIAFVCTHCGAGVEVEPPKVQ